MSVYGHNRSDRSPAIVASINRPSNFSLAVAPGQRAASASSTSKPMLCLVFSYFLPILPKPTISFICHAAQVCPAAEAASPVILSLRPLPLLPPCPCRSLPVRRLHLLRR